MMSESCGSFLLSVLNCERQIRRVAHVTPTPPPPSFTRELAVCVVLSGDMIGVAYCPSDYHARISNFHLALYLRFPGGS